MYNTTPALSTALNTQYIHLRLLAEAVPLMVPTAQPLADSTGTPVFVLATDRLPDGQVEQENILSLSHTAVCCGSDIGIGGVYAASLSCTLNGSHSLLDVTLRAQIGAEVDGTVEWLPLGTFVVTDCRRGDDQTTFTAYDAAYYALGQDYVPTVNSGSTVAQVLTDLAQQCGLAVEPATLAMGTMAVDGDLSGHSCREMLGYLAALCGKNAVITRDGAIRFLWFAASGAAVTAEDYYDGQLSNGGTSRLSGLTCTVPADGDSREEQTLTAGDSALAVALECPYMTQERLDAIWADVGGYAYPIGDVGFYGGVLTEPGDILTLTNREGVTISFPVMQVSLSLDGGCRCQISAFGQAETSRTSARTGPLSQAVQTAAETAGRALTTAKTAMTSANGKNKVFHQGSAPAASEGLASGDLWFNTAEGNQVSTWDGTKWVLTAFGSQAIANLDVGKLTSGTINTQSFQVETDYYCLTVATDQEGGFGLNFYTGDDPEDAYGTCLTLLGSYAGIYAYGGVDIYGQSGVTVGCGGAGSISLNGDVNVSGELTVDGLHVGGLVTETKTATISVNANAGKTGTFSVAKSGYTPLGIVGHRFPDSGAPHMFLYRSYLSGTTYNWGARNLNTETSYSGSLTVTVLYVKN